MALALTATLPTPAVALLLSERRLGIAQAGSDSAARTRSA